MVQVPAGRIRMKDAAGRDVEHAIKSFWIARYETQWEEYDAFWLALDLTDAEGRTAYEGRNVQRLPDENTSDWHHRKVTDWRSKRTEVPYEPPNAASGEANPGTYPADCIEFRAAKKYCTWLSQHTGKHFRLPTEAEWEYACRAGGPPLKPDLDALREIAWFKINADERPFNAHRIVSAFDEDIGGPHPVGLKRPNPWGLYDMLGNVGEYVIRDPSDDKGLFAGGSYHDTAENVHSGAREPYSKDWTKNDPQVPPMNDWLNWSMHRAGFRVVMDE
jgi:formylglycine-generating enzyme required for sulfatase activity